MTAKVVTLIILLFLMGCDYKPNYEKYKDDFWKGYQDGKGAGYDLLDTRKTKYFKGYVEGYEDVMRTHGEEAL